MYLYHIHINDCIDRDRSKLSNMNETPHIHFEASTFLKLLPVSF